MGLRLYTTDRTQTSRTKMSLKDPEKRREDDRIRARAYYYAHRDEVHAKAKARRKASPEIAREQYVRYMADPDVKARRLEANRKRYREVYAKDPAYRAAMTARHQKRKAEIAPEIVAERYLRERVEALGGMCPKFVDPSRRGAPDRMVILPGKPIFFVEMKRYKIGKVRPWQDRYHADLRACGHKVWVLWSKEDVDAFIAEVTLT